MTEKKFSRILGVLFLVVGVLATVNTWRFMRYEAATRPRDDAQEQCQRETLTALSQWVHERIQRDVTADARDDAAVALLDKMATGNLPTPEEATQWRDAVAADGEERRQATRGHSTLPSCDP